MEWNGNFIIPLHPKDEVFLLNIKILQNVMAISNIILLHGPLLFLIYVNDISKASIIFDFISYADDTTLSSQIHCFGDAKDNDNISNNS